MKIAFISDIHGNAVALERVIEDIEKQHVDKIVVMGDISYRGPEPKRSLDLVRSLDADVLKGNADEWLVRGVRAGEVPDQALQMMNQEREWSLSFLDQQDLDYLAELPTELNARLSETIRIHAFHATPTSLFQVVLPDHNEATLEKELMSTEHASMYMYAHIHLPYVRYMKGKTLVNIGSVGLPFDGLPQSAYALVEGEDDRYRVTIERVPYDVNRVIKQYQQGDYPNAELMTKVVRQAVRP